MATAPIKSQPLHNFSLSFLKWGKNQMNNQRCRRPADSSRESPPGEHRSPASEADSDGGSKNDSGLDARKFTVGSRSARNRFTFSSCSMEKSKKQQVVLPREGAEVDEAAEKVLVRLRTESKDKSACKNKAASVVAEDEVEESIQKPWNLRPRRAVLKPSFEIGVAVKNTEITETENMPKSLRLRGFIEGQNCEKKEKRKFWISLSREEIEEDIFVMTGSKPARRPRKRSKNVQKQLDNVFPGLWLAGITPDAYRVPDAPVQR